MCLFSSPFCSSSCISGIVFDDTGSSTTDCFESAGLEDFRTGGGGGLGDLRTGLGGCLRGAGGSLRATGGAEGGGLGDLVGLVAAIIAAPAASAAPLQGRVLVRTEAVVVGGLVAGLDKFGCPELFGLLRTIAGSLKLTSWSSSKPPGM